MDRNTAEVVANPVEKLSFTFDEAALSVRALAYYCGTQVQTLEANWDVEGAKAFHSSVPQATDRLDIMARLVDNCRGLSGKMIANMENTGEYSNYSAEDIRLLGDALFRFGNSGAAHATTAIAEGKVGSKNDAAKMGDLVYVEQTALSAYKLFKELEPVAMSNPDISQGWFFWEQLEDGSLIIDPSLMPARQPVESTPFPFSSEYLDGRHDVVDRFGRSRP